MTTLPWVDPHMAPLLEEMRAAPPVDYRAMTIAETRAFFARNARVNNEDPPPLAEVRDLAIPAPGGERAARIYRPEGASDEGIILYAHGGGWTLGSIDTHDRTTRLLAVESGRVVVSLDYRLAPEHPAPAGAQDMLAAMDAAARGLFGSPVSLSRQIVSGDSAGANIALAALVLNQRRNGARPAGAILFYGAFAPLFDTWSQKAYGAPAWGLPTERMRYAWEAQLSGQAPTDPIAAPLHADLAGLPPLHQIAAGLDPLCDDAIQLARRAAEAGVPTSLEVVPGVIHGFLRLSRRLPAAQASLRRAGHLANGLLG